MRLQKTLLLFLAVLLIGTSQVASRLQVNFGSVALAHGLLEHDDDTNLVTFWFNSDPTTTSRTHLVLAEESFDTALKTHPNETRALVMKGMLCLLDSHFTEASEVLTRANVFAPNDILVRFYQGVSYYLSDQPDLAINAWQESNNVDIFLWRLGREYLAQHNLEQSVAIWRLSERVDSTPKKPKQQMYWFMCDTNSKQEVWEEALYWCSQAYAADPRLAKELVLARALVATGHTAEAKRIAGKALTSAQASPSELAIAHWVLARAHIQESRFDEALLEYSQAIQLVDWDKYIYFDLARLYVQMGRYDDAERTIQTVQHLDSGSGALAGRVREFKKEMDRQRVSPGENE